MRDRNGKWVNPISVRVRNQMEQDILDNLWKTERIASSFHMMTGLPLDELESVARMCLMKCAESYKPDAPANFSTWVNRCLRLHLLNFLRDKSRIIKIPRKYSLIYLKVRKLYKADPNMTSQKASEILGIPIKDIVAVNLCFKTTLVDIDFFSEEIIGGGEGVVDDYLLDRQLEFNSSETEPEYLNFSFINKLSERERQVLNDTLIRGLCDNTLQRKYKTDVKGIVEEAWSTMSYIYKNAKESG